LITTNNYDEAGNRSDSVLANGITANYTYDTLNRLTNIVHSGSLSSFAYTLNENGMRHTISETLKTSGSTSETHNITYTYDNLNHLKNETAVCSSPSGSYSEDYDYDIVGNRTYRSVTANGVLLTTDYQYVSGSDRQTDRLSKEVHAGPLVVKSIGDKRYYAYASGSGIIYRSF